MVGTARRRGSDVSRGGTIGIRRFVIDDEDCETLCESYVTHTRVCEKKPKSARQRAKSRQKRHQRDCPTVLFLTRVHEFHSYTNAPSRTAAKLTRRGNSIFQGLRPTKNHTETGIWFGEFAPQIGKWDHDNLSDGFAKSRRVEVLTVSKPRKCDSLFARFFNLSSATSKQRQRLHHKKALEGRAWHSA